MVEISGRDKDKGSMMDNPDWKRLLAGKGYKWKNLDPSKSFGTCMLCGKYKQVFNLGGQFYVCPKHEAQVRLNGGLTRRVGLSLSGIECHLCGRKEFYNAYVVYGGKICTKCQWKKLAKKSHVMKVGGSKAW